MKTSKILLIISIALLLNNCSKERKLWEEAKKLNTISNYENFINENPNSMFVDSAYVKIEQIKSFLKADSLATISSYEDFLVSFPSGSLADSAKLKIESIEYKKAFDEYSAKALNDFLEKYPQSNFKQQIEDEIKSGEIYKNIKNDETALIYSTKNGYYEIVKALIAMGADVNAKTNTGTTALMYAALNGHIECVEAILAKGADVNVKTKTGWTALMVAVINGSIDIVEALLSNGADVNAKTKYGTSALMPAIQKGNVEIVRLLKENGATEVQVPDMKVVEKVEIKSSKDSKFRNEFNYGRPFCISLNVKVPNSEILKWNLISNLAEKKLLDKIVFTFFGTTHESPGFFQVLIGEEVPLDIAQSVIRVLSGITDIKIYLALKQRGGWLLGASEQKVYIGSLNRYSKTPVTKERLHLLLNPRLSIDEFHNIILEQD